MAYSHLHTVLSSALRPETSSSSWMMERANHHVQYRGVSTYHWSFMCHQFVTASTRAHQTVLRASGLTRP